MPGDFFGCTMMDLYQLVYWRWPWSNMRIIDQPVEKTEKDDQQKLGFWMLLGTAQNMMSDVGL